MAPYGALLALSSAASVALWWHVWLGHPSSTTLCDCGDPGQYLWFLAAPAQALAHGHSPLLTHAAFAPGGVNLLDNPGVLGLGVVLAPLTLVAGPVVALNVALTAAAPLAALSCAILLRRWVSWPAAAAGALAFGFSPFVAGNLAVAHLQAGFLALLPVMALCFDELLVRQRFSPVACGAGLGVLVAVQFFVSPEMLLIAVFSATIGIGMLAGWALGAARDRLRAAWVHGARGLAVAVVLAGALLAYPVWFALAGPRHTVGSPWAFVAGTGNPWRDFLLVHPGAGHPVPGATLFGYLGPAGAPTAYLGPVVVGLCLATLLVWRRRGVVWFSAAMALVTGVLSLGAVWQPHSPGPYPWLPWRLFAHVPLIDEISPYRLSAVVDLFVVVLLSVGLDGVLHGGQASGHHAVARDMSPGSGHGSEPRARLASAPEGFRPLSARWLRTWRGRWTDAPSGVRALAGVALVAAVAIPVGGAERLPYTVRHLAVPAWFTHDGRHLPPHSVVLAVPWDANQVIAWQAIAGMPFELAGGNAFVPGSNGRVAQHAAPGSAAALLYGLSLFGPAPAPTPTALATLRRAMQHWRVTTVVVAPGIRPPAAAVGFLTAALASVPLHRQGVWLWPAVAHAPPPAAVPADILGWCGASSRRADPGAVARCVLAAGRPAYQVPGTPSPRLSSPRLSSPRLSSPRLSSRRQAARGRHWPGPRYGRPTRPPSAAPR